MLQGNMSITELKIAMFWQRVDRSDTFQEPVEISFLFRLNFCRSPLEEACGSGLECPESPGYGI